MTQTAASDRKHPRPPPARDADGGPGHVAARPLGAAMERARAVLIEERLLQLTPTEVAQIDAALDAALDTEPRVVPLPRPTPVAT